MLRDQIVKNVKLEVKVNCLRNQILKGEK